METIGTYMKNLPLKNPISACWRNVKKNQGSRLNLRMKVQSYPLQQMKKKKVPVLKSKKKPQVKRTDLEEKAEPQLYLLQLTIYKMMTEKR